MAKDVRNALLKIIMEKGGKTTEEAEKYIQDLSKSQRYQTDVWF